MPRRLTSEPSVRTATTMPSRCNVALTAESSHRNEAVQSVRTCCFAGANAKRIERTTMHSWRNVVSSADSLQSVFTTTSKREEPSELRGDHEAHVAKILNSRRLRCIVALASESDEVGGPRTRTTRLQLFKNCPRSHESSHERSLSLQSVVCRQAAQPVIDEDFVAPDGSARLALTVGAMSHSVSSDLHDRTTRAKGCARGAGTTAARG